MIYQDQFLPGHQVAQKRFPPISRAHLAYYCGVAGNHATKQAANKSSIHLDLDMANSAGFDDVFVHGMLVKELMSRAVTDLFGQQAVTKIDTQFVAPTQLGDAITTTVLVESVTAVANGMRVKVVTEAKTHRGLVVAKGRAVCLVNS